jgi:hypothetical protein
LDKFNEIENITDKERLTTEKEFLLAIKSVMNTHAGRTVIYQILNMTAPLALKNFTGNSFTYYNLGIQYVGKQIIETLVKARCNVNVTDISKHLEMNINRLDQIEIELNKLKEEEKEDDRRNK